MKLPEELLRSSGFTPHGFCVACDLLLVWADVVSDALTALAYFSIPLVLLAIFVRRGRDLVYPWVFGLFALFILLCGGTHVLAAITFWVPAYGLEAVLKVLTAIASVATAIALWPLLPRILAMPTAAQLQAQIDARENTEWRLKLLVDGVSNYAIFMTDTGGLITSWNSGAARLKGYTESEILGRDSSCFCVEEDIAAGKPAQELADAAAEGRCQTEGWRLRKDGTRFWANVLITAIRAPDGALSASVPILAISGGGASIGLNYLDVALRLGATAVLAKPFGPAELATQVGVLRRPAE